MKSIYALLLLLALCFTHNSLHAQTAEFEVPRNVVLESPADCAVYESKVIAAVNWLEETELGRRSRKRKAVNAFLMKWIHCSHGIKFVTNKSIFDMTRKRDDLSLIYMSGFARYWLQNKNNGTVDAAIEDGTRTLLKIYHKGNVIKHSRAMKRLAKAEANGKLESYILGEFE